ncbi:MAG: DUF4097 family beta strand repeat-containing protein [bacterium]
MRRIIPVVALLGAACLYTFQATDDVTVLRSATGLTELRLTTASGEVSVAGAATDQVSGTATRKAWGRTQADAEAALGTIAIVDSLDGTVMLLSARLPGERRPLGCGFALAVPESLELAVSATNSPVSVSGIRARVSVTTSSARVSATGTEGPLVVSTTSGPINLLDTEGDATLSTRSAPVTVQVHSGPIDARTSSGAITCELGPTGPLDPARIETSDGPIDLYLPGDVSARITARTTNGIITIHGFTVQYEVQTPDSVVGIIGTGATQLDLFTTNGNITVQGR